jgi:hypothetical protein
MLLLDKVDDCIFPNEHFEYCKTLLTLVPKELKGEIKATFDDELKGGYNTLINHYEKMIGHILNLRD